MTIRNSPSVTSVIGKVRMIRTGRTKALTMPSSSAAAISVSLKSKEIPGTIFGREPQAQRHHRRANEKTDHPRPPATRLSCRGGRPRRLVRGEPVARLAPDRLRLTPTRLVLRSGALRRRVSKDAAGARLAPPHGLWFETRGCASRLAMRALVWLGSNEGEAGCRLKPPASPPARPRPRNSR